MSDELKQETIDEIAKGIYDEMIFTNAHLEPPDDPMLQSMVFIGLTFEDEESIISKKNHTLIYQYLDKQVGWILHDGKKYPTFMTYKSCSREDHARILDVYRVLKQREDDNGTVH